jgi:hypothetical protein
MPKELHDKAMKLGASNFGYSKAKGKKYFVVYDGKTINFGAKGMSDFTKHKDEDRRKRYYARHSKIKDKSGKKVITQKSSPSFWSYNLLWK